MNPIIEDMYIAAECFPDKAVQYKKEMVKTLCWNRYRTAWYWNYFFNMLLYKLFS